MTMLYKHCRICLTKTFKFSCFSSGENSVKYKMRMCVPEIDFNVISDPVLCDLCTKKLNLAYKFKLQCLDLEGKITDYIKLVQPESLHINLIDVLRMVINDPQGKKVSNASVIELSDAEDEDNIEKEMEEVLSTETGDSVFDLPTVHMNVLHETIHSTLTTETRLHNVTPLAHLPVMDTNSVEEMIQSTFSKEIVYSADNGDCEEANNVNDLENDDQKILLDIEEPCVQISSDTGISVDNSKLLNNCSVIVHDFMKEVVPSGNYKQNYIISQYKNYNEINENCINNDSDCEIIDLEDTTPVTTTDSTILLSKPQVQNGANSNVQEGCFNNYLKCRDLDFVSKITVDSAVKSAHYEQSRNTANSFNTDSSILNICSKRVEPQCERRTLRNISESHGTVVKRTLSVPEIDSSLSYVDPGATQETINVKSNVHAQNTSENRRKTSTYAHKHKKVCTDIQEENVNSNRNLAVKENQVTNTSEHKEQKNIRLHNIYTDKNKPGCILKDGGVVLNPFGCTKCPSTFETINLLLKHVKSHMIKSNYTPAQSNSKSEDPVPSKKTKVNET